METEIGEDQDLRPAHTNSLRDPITTKIRAKWAGSLAQALEYLLCMRKALCSNPSLTRKTVAFFSSVSFII
jgi:hypothetical protein